MSKKTTNKQDSIETNNSIFQNDSDDSVNIKKQLVGLFVFVSIFVCLIPYLLVKYKYFNIIEGYIPNVDMIATVIGFQREPFLNLKSYFKYLYNPDVKTIYGYFSQTFINYLALLGVTFFIAYYTFKNKSILKGWSRAFIMLPMTYLLPGNFIAYYMSKLSDYLDSNKVIKNVYIKDFLVYGSGITSILFFIYLEQFLIENLSDIIANILSKFLKF